MSAGSGHGIHATVDIAWRGAATLCLKAGTIPGPGHFQLIEVVGAYLIGGRVAGMSKVITERRPFDGVLSVGGSGRK